LKRLVNQIFIIPILFLFFGMLSFGVFYAFFINEITKKEFEKAKNTIIENEKNMLKTKLKSTVSGVDSIRSIGFNITEEILKNILEMGSENYLRSHHGAKEFFNTHNTKELFFYIISKDIVYPKITQTFIKVGDRKRLIVIYNEKKYLGVEEKIGNKIIGVAFSLDSLNQIIKHEIKEFIKKLNKYEPLNYIAIGEVTNWFANSGVFGKIFYHPISSLIGKQLSMDEPDIKGYHYRREYFNCLKIKDECFLEYYFKNPQTGKDEKKISYFSVYRPYNMIFTKGLYISQISKDINAVTREIIKETKKLFISTILLLILFSIVSFIMAYFISRKIMNKVLEDYERLNKSYEKSKKLLNEKIYFDKVTKLPNQVKLLEDINKFDSLIILDIDDFASINNLYGFEVGDKILLCVAKFLKSKFKNVYKVGSDEFAVPLKVKVGDKTLKKISKWDIECGDIMIVFKIGASNIKNNLFITAENALKIAQKKNIKYLIYDENLKNLQQQKFETLKKLRKILKNEDIVPYYQCIIDNNGNILKYEALMRLKFKNEILSPFMFMDIIKEAKLYHEFSRIMIKKVFREVKIFNLKEVAINLSFVDIVEHETRKLIIDLLEKFSIGDRITFEILESESIQNFEEVKRFINEVKYYGSKIAIDDFGSGYSNLINILSLEPDFIKIDGSLIQNIENKEYFEIIKLITEFSKKFNIKVIAEFVENKEVFEKLKNIGVDYFQGYNFCKPVSIEDIISLKKG